MESRHPFHSASGFQGFWELRCILIRTISIIQIQIVISQNALPCGIKSSEPLEMEYVIEQGDYYPVSLGMNCFPRMYTQRIYKKIYPRLPFDYVGTPMWGINEAIKADFKGFASIKCLQPYKIYKNEEYIRLTNVNYMIAFLHDHLTINNEKMNPSLISKEQSIKVEQDYLRRIQRWKALLDSGSKLLFFRLTRSEEERIQYVTDKPSEKDALEEFSRTMKARNVRFKILYFTYDHENSYDTDSQIIYVNISKIEKITVNLIGQLLSDDEILRHVRESLNQPPQS